MPGQLRARDAERSAYRLDLQGLRGIGVILVVLGHLFRAPSGAFSALDMFFVLSGFLITGLLIKMNGSLGRIYFTPFYLNRVRRLMPTATVAIVVTIGLYYLVFSEARGDQVATDGLWAFLWVVNWHFTKQGTNYFEGTTESPFLHYWSLSVEEQFYLVWPLLLVLGLFAASRSRRPQATLLGVLGLVTVASFSYSMWHSVASPTGAYFSTFDRAWEFGIGGMIAAARPLLSRLPRRLCIALGWGGALGLLLPVFLLSRDDPFPAPWALPAVLLTGAIIVGGIAHGTEHLVILHNRPMIYVGDMSYSIYIWHVLVILLLEPFITPETVPYYLTVVALTAVVSVISYYLIERPMRYARWLMTPPERRLFASRSRDYTLVRRGWMTVGAVLAAGFAAWTFAAPEPHVASVATTPLPMVEKPQQSLADLQQARLRDALAQTSFPIFDPPLKRLGIDKWLEDQRRYGCITVVEENVDDCRFGRPGATKRAVLVGDSIGIGWMPGVRTALEPQGWSVQQLTLLECGTWQLSSYIHSDGTDYPECEEHQKFVKEYILREKPDLVVLASAALQVRNSERPGFPDGTTVARQGLSRTLAALARSGSRIVVLSPPGGSAALLECATRFGSPNDCVTQPGGFRSKHRDGESAAAAAASVRYIDTQSWFCVESSCPAFVGRTPVLVDGGHLTIPFSKQLAPLLRQSLLGPAPRTPS